MGWAVCYCVLEALHYGAAVASTHIDDDLCIVPAVGEDQACRRGSIWGFAALDDYRAHEVGIVAHDQRRLIAAVASRH